MADEQRPSLKTGMTPAEHDAEVERRGCPVTQDWCFDHYHDVIRPGGRHTRGT